MILKLMRIKLGIFKSKIKSMTNQRETMAYTEIKLLLPDITDVNLRKRTFKAKKIHALFEGIGIDKIRQITYSVNAILSLKVT